MEGKELFFEIQELPDDTDLICYVYTENGATYALQYEQLSRSAQRNENNNIYLVKRYANQDKNIEEYAYKGEFYDLREGDLIRVYFDGVNVHVTQKIPGEYNEVDHWFSLPGSGDTFMNEDTFAPYTNSQWLKEITSNRYYNYVSVSEEVTAASTQTVETTEQSTQTKKDSKETAAETEAKEETKAVTSDSGPGSTPDVHVNVPKLVGLIVLIVLAVFVVLFRNQVKERFTTLMDTILNKRAPKPQSYNEQPNRSVASESGMSSSAFGRKTISDSCPTMQSVEAQNAAVQTNLLHMDFAGSCMPRIGLGEITKIINKVELVFSYDETTQKFDVRSRDNTDISFVQELDTELKRGEMFFAAADEKQLLVATEISKNKIRLEPIQDVCDTQSGDVLPTIIRGMDFTENFKERPEAVYALMKTILEAPKRPRAYTDVGLYEKLKTYSEKHSYKLPPQPDNDLLCLLSFVCLTPNADDSSTMLLIAQTFASKLIKVLDTSFTAIETAPAPRQTVQQLSVQQQNQPPAQPAPSAPPQPDPETLRKKRNREILETLETVHRDSYQEKLMSKHGEITFYSLADAVTKTDSPISIVTKPYRSTAQFVCIDTDLWLNPLKDDYSWIGEVMNQELKLRELQELFEITGSGRTEYSCQEPAILSLQEESLRVVKKGILVRC